MITTERASITTRLRGIALQLESGERDDDFIEASMDGVALRNLVVDLLREVAEAIDNGRMP